MSTSGGYHGYIGDVQYIGDIMMHVEDTMSTPGDVQNIKGFSEHWGMFRTLGDVQNIGGYHDACGGYHEYIEGCSVHRKDTMSTSGGYHEYIGGYHEYIGGIS